MGSISGSLLDVLTDRIGYDEPRHHTIDGE